MHEWDDHIDPELHRKLLENVEVMSIIGGIRKYFQPLHVKMFHDYIRTVKREYSKTHQLIYGEKCLITREALVKLHHLTGILRFEI